MNYVKLDSPDQVNSLRLALLHTLDGARAQLKQLAEPFTPEVFMKLRFEQPFSSPLAQAFGRQAGDTMNLIEFMNQAYTYLTGLAAISYLMRTRSTDNQYILYRSTYRGHDFESIEGRLIAEVFASTASDTNRRLKQDIDRIKYLSNREKFIFFCSPSPKTKVRIPPSISVFHATPELVISGADDAFSQVVN